MFLSIRDSHISGPISTPSKPSLKAQEGGDRSARCFHELTLDELFAGSQSVMPMFTDGPEVDAVTQSIRETAHLNQRQEIPEPLPKGYILEDEPA